MGVYHLALSLYVFITTLVSGGLTTVIAQKVSTDPINGETIARSSCIFFFFLGLFFSVTLSAFAVPISKLINNDQCALLLVSISPAICLTPISATIKGYFQGKKNVTPSAISQIVEACVKTAFTFALSLLFASFVTRPIVAMASITISELVCFLFLLITYLSRRERKGRCDWGCLKGLLPRFFTNTVTVLLIPLSQLIDSFLIINLLAFSNSIAVSTSLYGIVAGPVSTLVNVPSIIVGALSTCILPSFSNMNSDSRKRSFINLFVPVFTLSVGFAISLFIFAPIIVNTLFPSVSSYLPTSVSLLRIASLECVFLCIIRLENTYLQAKGKFVSPAINLFVSLILKTTLTIALVPSLSIYGYAIASVIGYAVASMLNFIILQFDLCFGFPTKLFVKLAIGFVLFTCIAFPIFDLFPSLLGAIIAFLFAIVTSISYCLTFDIFPHFRSFLQRN